MADTHDLTVIAPGTSIKGDMTLDRTAHLLGSFEGTIGGKGELRIGRGGRCNATITLESVRIEGSAEGRIRAANVVIGDGAVCKSAIEADKVVVNGSIEGNVIAREHLELSGKGRIAGDVVAARLTVAEGGSFVGHFTVGPDAAKKAGEARVVETKPPSQAVRKPVESPAAR